MNIRPDYSFIPDGTCEDSEFECRRYENQIPKLTTLPESPTMDGYTFNGWYTEPVGGSRITTATVFTGDTTIYAQWTAKSSSASPTTPTPPMTGGPALQKHLGTLLVAGILVTLVVVAAV